MERSSAGWGHRLLETLREFWNSVESLCRSTGREWKRQCFSQDFYANVKFVYCRLFIERKNNFSILE